MPNSATVPNPPQMPASTQEYVKYLLKMRGYTVQRLCDETSLSKSTMDKFLAGQTYDTSFTNVKTAVKHLGGSLDYLAHIEAEAPDLAPSSPAPPIPHDEKKIRADYPALALLVESYEKEIRRLSDVYENHLSHVVSLIEAGRQALITQHTAAIEHEKELCASIVSEKQEHLESFKNGRNVWRFLSLFLSVVLVSVAVWLVWEFSNLSSGLTGYLLRESGLISMAGGMM